MKSKLIFSTVAIIFLISSIAPAQREVETIYNPKTRQRERVYNPLNQAQQELDRENQARREQEINNNIRDINDTYHRRREEANEQTKRNQEWWQDRMRDMQFKMMELNSRRNYGNSIIKAGKARTAFIPGPNFSLKAILLQNADSPQMKQSVEQYADSSLKKFRDELKAKGLNINDVADGGALAFVMCYEIYFEQKPSNAILESTRQSAKQALLKDPVFQSYEHKEHQQEFETCGALAGYARILYDKGKAGDEFALREAKVHARTILEKLWGNAIHTLSMNSNGFIHTGRKIIDEGKATTVFKFNPNIKTAEMNVRRDSQYRNQLINENQQNLNLFYQALAQKGGQKNDLAWCATIAAYANFLVLTKGQDWTPTQTSSAYNFFKTAILKSEEIQAVSDEVKQIACEQMAIKSAANYVKFKKGEIAVHSVAIANLKELFQVLGEDLEKYDWTATGIVKVK